ADRLPCSWCAIDAPACSSCGLKTTSLPCNGPPEVSMEWPGWNGLKEYWAEPEEDAHSSIRCSVPCFGLAVPRLLNGTTSRLWQARGVWPASLHRCVQYAVRKTPGRASWSWSVDTSSRPEPRGLTLYERA